MKIALLLVVVLASVAFASNFSMQVMTWKNCGSYVVGILVGFLMQVGGTGATMTDLTLPDPIVLGGNDTVGVAFEVSTHLVTTLRSLDLTLQSKS